MNSESCQPYLQDPEANAAHLAGCEKCRALAETLSARVDEASGLRPRASVELPLASWEGASYRSWRLVVAGAVLVGALAVVLFVVTGTSPLTVAANLPSAGVIVSTLRHVGAAAPGLVAILFILVNAIFIALLRRAPRGIDV
ncbi:MAG TPA: hypothetical protein VLV78_03790 [Thermoanaerobaculia bacterium]|nr:hypothetical protein [Thermoanaerobaculia bacterium]